MRKSNSKKVIVEGTGVAVMASHYQPVIDNAARAENIGQSWQELQAAFGSQALAALTMLEATATNAAKGKKSAHRTASRSIIEIGSGLNQKPTKGMRTTKAYKEGSSGAILFALYDKLTSENPLTARKDAIAKAVELGQKQGQATAVWQEWKAYKAALLNSRIVEA